MRRTDLNRLDREICGCVWTSPYAKELMEVISYEFGPRPAGSKAMKKTAEFLGKVLTKLGARDVHTEQVPVFAWRCGASHVELLAPHRRSYENIQYVHSGSGTISAVLVDGGSGGNEDLDRLGKRLKGAIVLISGHPIAGGKHVPFPKSILNISDRGAAGILVRNVYEGIGPAIEVACTTQDIPIPVLGVSYEDGHELASFAHRGRAKVRIQAGGRSYRTSCVNLVAELGPRRAEDVIVLSAHLDSHHVSPGAFDNLTGVVTLIEIVRALAAMRLLFKRTLRVILFTGEEYMFQGSKGYVKSNMNGLDRIRFVFNMDSLLSSTAEGVAVMWSPTMRDYIDRALRQTRCRVDVRNFFCMSSDYLPFMLEGIAAGRPADWKGLFPPISHTRVATPDKVPTEWIRMNAMTYAQMLVRMLTDPKPLPAKRKSPQQVKHLVKQEGAEDHLRLLGFDV